MSRAVVIGGAGFLGQRTVECLLGVDMHHPDWPRFDELRVFDTKPFVLPAIWKRQADEADINLSYIKGDIRQLEELETALTGADLVFHMASMVYVGLRRNALIDQVNIEGTKNVIKACQQCGVQYLIYTSSEDVVLGKTPIRDGDETLPYPEVVIHDYVRTKIEGERLILAANGISGLKTCSLRPVHIYGPGDPHALIPSLRAFKSGKVPFLMGDGSAQFDVVFVDNVVHAHLLAAKSLIDDSSDDLIAGEAFFIGENNAPNYFDWLKPYAEAMKIKMPSRKASFSMVLLMARMMEAVHRITGLDVPFHRFHAYVLCNDFYFSNNKAERLLGYSPLSEKEEAFRKTVSWLKETGLHSTADN